MTSTKRIIFQVPVELAERMKIRIPWGFLPTLIRLFLEKLMDAIDKEGDIVIGAILSGQYTLEYTHKKPSHSGTPTTGAGKGVQRTDSEETTD
ncbi:MAG: hypothetical protein C5B59_17380 [Bacteroidetes bacterium]|nr:MAG: hypothetical protein C5B59_17380 [Bacteroidota bacterium]